MAVRQMPVRLDSTVIQQLKMRAAIEGRSVNDIVTTAIREYSSAHPVPRAQMLEMVRAIASEDAELLEALAKA